MSNLAIIPARGGSKGIPRKNILPLCGKPLIAWNIEAAQAAQSIERVVVSTDDPEIGAVAQQFGADVVWRPPELSGDLSSSEAALLHVLEELQSKEGYQPELTVFLQCTSPLTAAVDIDGTVDALIREKADTALAVIDFHYFLWQRAKTGDTIGINHDKTVRLMRQEREPQYLETGAIYLMRTEGFLRHKHRFFGRTAFYEMPPERRLEIDDPVDFSIGELLLRQQLKDQQINLLPKEIKALVFDFDGVFTDNKVLVMEDGREAVLCDRGDGMGLSKIKDLGIPLLVLSKERNPVVATRCEKLKIECMHGIDAKRAVLKDWSAKKNIDLADIVYVGNDINDIECLEAVGCGIVVSDAHEATRAYARIILSRPGGQGAIRELTDLIQSTLKPKEA